MLRTGLTAHGDKRYLRSSKETLGVDDEEYVNEADDDNDDDDGKDEEEEERGPLDYYVKRYGQGWVDKWVARSEYRVNDRKTPGQIKDKYTDHTGAWRSEKARDKYNLFLAEWLKVHPGGI
ncbi:hypothetical protein PHYBOEH_005643 [Phytophthora boehmeriae]|uniref:Uncharacterized protein n=1 Tax=Phytophthora boehmeriae TaxID=109152 RepID=A0A8T1WL50_9STRA|nr:hypothetical protein PHYBOEH_005643 [Phytophthora boehmeriae]